MMFKFITKFPAIKLIGNAEISKFMKYEKFRYFYFL